MLHISTLKGHQQTPINKKEVKEVTKPRYSPAGRRNHGRPLKRLLDT